MTNDHSKFGPETMLLAPYLWSFCFRSQKIYTPQILSVFRGWVYDFYSFGITCLDGDRPPGLKAMARDFLKLCNHHECIASNARVPGSEECECSGFRCDNLFSMGTWIAIGSPSQEDLSTLVNPKTAPGGLLPFATTVLQSIRPKQRSPYAGPRDWGKIYLER